MLKFNSILPRVMFKANKIKYGCNLKLIGYPFIFRFPNAEIIIGDNCLINSSFFSNLLGLYQRTIIIARDQGKIKIGNHVGISGATIYARDSIEIGNYTLIGANTKIFDNDFHPLDSKERLNDDSLNLVTKPIKIGENVFIGCNSIILKGTEIGDNCVVGAGSVVHGKFLENSIIAGNPARLIKQNSGGENSGRECT